MIKGNKLKYGPEKFNVSSASVLVRIKDSFYGDLYELPLIEEGVNKKYI